MVARLCAGLVAGLWLPAVAVGDAMGVYAFDVDITSDLTLPNVPFDPWIDFAQLIREAGLPGGLDPNSIRVTDARTKRAVPHALSSEFAYGDAGRVQWVVADPTHREYEIRFRTVTRRPPLRPRKRTALIGNGDLLRYNAGEPRPIALIYPSGLVDLTGDGTPDLVGCWNYAYRPGEPWDGVVCYPRVGSGSRFQFGDLLRVRYLDGGGEPQQFTSWYMCADFADLNGDGLIDLVYSPRPGNELHLYLNSGRRDAAGLPLFQPAGSLPRPADTWAPVRAVDLNGDGAIDLVVGSFYLRNTNPRGWPPEVAEPMALDAGRDPCFYDVDGDGRLDAVCLLDGPADEPRAWRVGWRRNLGGDPPTFGPPQPLEDIDEFWCTSVAAVSDGPRRGLLVGHNVWQEVSFYQQVAVDPPRFRRFGRAESLCAVMSLSDQAWPWACDWDGDGDLDLLVGGGYGWPRIVLNEGTLDRPRFAEARLIEANGEPIRLLRDEVLGGRHWHDMGYPYPAFVDWDGDGLPDLVLPNETNRIFWYPNVGTRDEPRFGPRRQVIADGYPDSDAARATSARLAADESVPNSPYPYEETQPFFWRTGAGFADLNGDGLMDLVTMDGHTRKLTLFVQYRDAQGVLRLRRHGPLKLSDGRFIDDSIVGRSAHWTESIRCVDWDGDGLIDLIYGCAGTERAKGSLYLLRNVGTTTEPLFAEPETLRCFGEPIKVTEHGPHPWVGDFDGDGRPDILTCVEWSVYPFYRHAALVMPERPTFRLGPVREMAGR